MLTVPLRLWLVAGAVGLAVFGGLALVTGHLSKIAIETGLISAIIVFLFLLGSTGPSAGLETAIRRSGRAGLPIYYIREKSGADS